MDIIRGVSSLTALLGLRRQLGVQGIPERTTGIETETAGIQEGKIGIPGGRMTGGVHDLETDGDLPREREIDVVHVLEIGTVIDAMETATVVPQLRLERVL